LKELTTIEENSNQWLFMSLGAAAFLAIGAFLYKKNNMKQNEKKQSQTQIMLENEN
jgi:hypothetical protein